MIQTADIKAKVMRLWGNPATTELSPQALRDAVETVWNLVTMEMSMVSPTFFTKFSETFYLSDGWTGSVSINDLGVPVAVEFRSNSSSVNENDWTQVDTAGVENWDYYKSAGQPVALLTGSGSGMQLRTNFDSAGGQFRIRYIADGQENDSASPLSDGIELPAFFSPMFEAGAAWKAGDLIVTNRPEFAAIIPSKAQGYNNEFLMYLGRFKQWLRSARAGKGVSYRTPSNATRRGSGLHWRNWGFPR